VTTSELAKELSRKYHCRVPHWTVRRTVDRLVEGGANVPRFGGMRFINADVAAEVESDLRRRRIVG
jgi:hypothetical protein